jgi:lipid-A-disaccharide synthase
MAQILDRVGVILPFEEGLLRGAGIAAEYVGHPLREQVSLEENPEQARVALGLAPDCPVLGLLPGSRPGEVENLLPIMLKGTRLARSHISEIRPVVALSTLVKRDRVDATVRSSGTAALVVEGQAQRVLRASRMAIVASGTATLEAALLGTPMVVVYRASWISYLLGRLLVKVRHIALANILAGRRIVPELLQGDLTPAALKEHIEHLWRDEDARCRMRDELRLVGESLGSKRASQNAARIVWEMVQATGASVRSSESSVPRPSPNSERSTPNVG